MLGLPAGAARLSGAGGPMWTCPRCGRSFANRNQQHACGPLDLERHLAGRDPEVLAIFERLVELAERNGPVTVLPEKTRIAFQVRMSFAAFALRRRWVDGHVVLARRLEHPRFRRVETFSSMRSVCPPQLRSTSCVPCQTTAKGKPLACGGWSSEKVSVDATQKGGESDRPARWNAA